MNKIEILINNFIFQPIIFKAFINYININITCMGCATSDSLPQEQQIQEGSSGQEQPDPFYPSLYQPTVSQNDLAFRNLEIQKFMQLFNSSKQQKSKLLQTQSPLIEACQQKIISGFGMGYKRQNQQKIIHQTKPETLSAAEEASDKSLPSLDDLLSQIKDALMNVPQLNVILSKKFFDYLFYLISKNNWNKSEKSQLVKLLINYMRYSLSQLSEQEKNQTKYNLSNFAQTFGKEADRLLKKVKIRNLYAIQSIKYLKNFERRSFSLQKVQEIVDMIKQIKQFSYNNTSVLAYLAYYLLKCCEDLDNAKVPVNQINEKLKSTVKRLKQIFSPRETIQQSPYNKAHISKIQEFDKKAPYKKFYFKSANKEMELSKYIMDIVTLAKSKYQKFTQLTSRICFNNGGFGYKSNLKLSQITQKLPLLRVKEKLTEEIIKSYYKEKTYDANTMVQLRQAQIGYLQETMKIVNQKLDFVQFTVSDMLRGKCMFNTIAQIVKVVNQLRNIKDVDFEVVKVGNRLSGITKDVMIKLRFGELTAQFQVALCFNQVQNHIHHKMYQVQRSKVFTPITMLSIWFDSIGKEFIEDLQGIIVENGKKNKAVLSNKLKRLKQMMKQTEEKKIQKISSEKKDYDDFRRVKELVTSTQILSVLKNRSFLREGICLWSIGQLKEAEMALIQYHKEQQIDMSSIGYLCLVSYGLGHYSLSLKCFLQATWFDELYRQKFTKNGQSFNKNAPRRIITQNLELVTKLLVVLGKFSIAQRVLDFYKKALQKVDSVHKQCLQQIVENNNGQKTSISLTSSLLRTYFNESKLLEHFNEYVDAVKLFVYLYSDSLQYKKTSIEYMMKVKRDTYENQKGIEDIKTIQAAQDFIYYYLSVGNFMLARKQLKKYNFFVKYFMAKESINYMNACLIISQYYEKEENYEKSQGYLVQALEVAKQKSLKLMKIKRQLAIVQIKNNKPLQALQCLKVSLEICRQLSPKNIKFLISVYSNMGLAYYKATNLQKAKQSIFQSRSLIQQIKCQIFPNKQNNIWVQYGVICAQILFQEKNYKLALYSAFFALFFYQFRENEYRSEKCKALHLMAECFYQLGLYKESYRHYEQVISLEEKCLEFVGLGNTLVTKYEKFKDMMGKKECRETLQRALSIYKRLNHKDTKKVEALINTLSLCPEEKVEKIQESPSMDMEEFQREFILRKILLYEKQYLNDKVLKMYELLIQRQRRLTGEKSGMYGQTLMRFYHKYSSIYNLPQEKRFNILKQAKQIYERINHPYLQYIDYLLSTLQSEPNKRMMSQLNWNGWRLNVPIKYFEAKKAIIDHYKKKTDSSPSVKIPPYSQPAEQQTKLNQNLCMIY